MTLQFTHHPTTTVRPAGAPRRFERWLVPAGLAVTAVLTVVAVDVIRDSEADTVPRPAVATAEITTDYTRSQRLIDQAIDEARISTDYTRSQRLIDQAIEDALAAR